MTKKKVAIIGGGNAAATAHLPYYQSRNDIEIVAVVGTNPEKMKQFSEKHNIPAYYTNMDNMYLTEKPAIVSVCTPNYLHFEHVMKALSYGCHVLCEKPPAISSKEAEQMMVRAEENNCVLAYNFHHRFAEDVQIIKKQNEAGSLGEIYVTKIKALRRSGVPGWGNFTNKQIQGGGPLIDLGIHMVDAAFYILGYPNVKKVTAKQFQKIGTKKSEGTFGKWDPETFDVEDSLFGFIELENGNLVLLETSFALNIKEKAITNVEFFGNKAGATLFPAQIYSDDKGKLVSLWESETQDADRTNKSLDSFINRCMGEKTMIANAYQGHQIQKLIEALYSSAEKNESVTL